tara:strand:- start:175 stop:810 length:636 start_codon:yes stop_codon:yes gene_type:complete
MTRLVQQQIMLRKNKVLEGITHFHMIPAQQPQMYQQPPQTMPAPQANIGLPMPQLASPKSNRGWILACGVHPVFMVSLMIGSLVYAMFDPVPDFYDFYGYDGFGDKLFFAMTDSTSYLIFSGYVVTVISVLMAMNANCNKLFAVSLPAVSHIATYLLWCVIVSSVFPEGDFSEAWEQVFGEDFFEVVLPSLISHIALCAGTIGLMSVSSAE